MGASNFSGVFANNPDYFDGDASETRDSATNDKPDLYDLLAELARLSPTVVKAAADGSAGTATAETPFWVTDTYIKSVQAVWFVPAANVVANGSNYATLSVYSRNAQGGGQTLLASVNTSTNGWTAFEPVELTLAALLGATALDLEVGDILTYAITKASSGVIVPAGALVVEVA